MNKKQHTFYGIFGLIIGIVGGIAGTAFSMGADKQRVNDTLIRHTAELDLLPQIISNQTSKIQESIAHLTREIGDLRTDVQVLKAIMERIEKSD